MTTIIDLARPAVTPPPAARTPHPALAPALVALGAALVSGIAIGVPSMWGDEAASVMSAQRPWDSLWAMAANVDAVHVVYYAMLHIWIDVFGASGFSVRLPSALAIGATAAGVFTLCRSLAGARIAVIASIACVLVPRIGFMAAEARSAALSAALVTWLTVLLVHLVRTGETRARWWVLYGGLLVVSVHLFLYTALIAAVHLLILLVLRAPRTIWWHWGFSAVLAVAACLPFVILTSGQHGQIAFLARRDVTSPQAILVGQWFGSLPIAIAAWSAIVIVTVWAVRSWRRNPPRAGEADRRSLVWIALAWLLIPMTLLLLANAVAGPLYTGRYLSFSAPAAGVLIAIAIALLRPRAAAVVASTLILLLTVPFAVSQRTENAKFGSDWAQVSAYVGAHSQPGDGVVFDEGVRPSRKPRLALRLYPDGFRDTADLGLVRSFETTAGLWDVVKPLEDLPDSLDGRERVWVVARSQKGTSDDERTLRNAGFELVDTRWFARDVILLYTKGTP
ncbi:glycosyltransferase family 39 protein [Microbacterium foliorum]|uniref:glycosyltransferase family 39 protein n=1 Tax=Microbacterium foliorum TaxID=104336 RepID=UPI001E4CD469|nr:glycosyltransferase family 39 protein [Microbacterium foliorum]